MSDPQENMNAENTPKKGGILAMPNDSTIKTVFVTVGVCLVCSIVVATAAIGLRDKQILNKAADKQKNILLVAGLDDTSQPVAERFESMQSYIIDLDQGVVAADVDMASFDQKASSKDPAMSVALSKDEDVAKIIRRENYAQIYIKPDANGGIDKLILPVKGYGLWSTLYGFVALDADLNTVYRLKFYDHKETPGLGGEVDNDRWRELWTGKKLFDDSGDYQFSVIKGNVDPNAADAQYKVDGIAGATLTTNGVSNLFQFWMGEQGFGPFLENLKQGTSGVDLNDARQSSRQDIQNEGVSS